MMSIDEKIAVMQAFRDGKTIQVFYKKGVNPQWLTRQNGIEPSWNFENYDYRVKPEPREFFVHGTVDGDFKAFPISSAITPCERCIRVREVLP